MYPKGNSVKVKLFAFGNFFCWGESLKKPKHFLGVYTNSTFNKALIALPEECMVFNGALPQVLSIMGTGTGVCIAFCVF